MTPTDIVASLKSASKGSADVLADWLADRGMPWTFPSPNNAPDEGEDCVAFCRWCRTPVSYPNRPDMIRFYRAWVCSCCSPVPDPRLIIINLLGRMSIQLQSDVTRRLGMSQTLAMNEAPYDLLEAVLDVINENT